MDTDRGPAVTGARRIIITQVAPCFDGYRPTIEQLGADGRWHTIWECSHMSTHNRTMAHSCAGNSVEGDLVDEVVIRL